MLKIHSLLHVPFEGLGHIAQWARQKGHSITYTNQFAGDALPELNEFDMLIVMGGPMGVYDENIYPWLASEKTFIKSAIDAGKKVMGICLGAQLIAEVMGAKVYPNSNKEIGWMDVHFSTNDIHPLFNGFPKQFTTFHWHGDTFDLPCNAKLILSSQACKNQAYIINNHVLGLQFHFETTPESLKGMIANCGDELQQNGSYIQSVSEIEHNQHHITTNQSLLELLLNRFSNIHE